MSKQHYIPQFILRNWTSEDGNIGIYHIKNKEFYKSKPKNQAQIQNLYGNDQKIEEAFASLESETSPIIKKLLDKNLDLDIQEKRTMKMFVANQYARVPIQVGKWNDIITFMVRDALSQTNKFSQEVISETNATLSKPPLEQVTINFDLYSAIIDLEIGLVRNTTKSDFVLGECPVLILNPLLASDKNYEGSRQGAVLTGAVILMPISPMYTLFLYDRNAYAFTRFKKIADANDEDVKLLNLCQFYNTKDCIFYNGNEKDFGELAEQSEEYRSNPKTIHNSLDIPSNKGGNQKLIHGTFLNYPITESFSFLHFKEDPYRFSNNGERIEAIYSINTYKQSELYPIFHRTQSGPK